jgi:hypothetical protein
MALAFNPPTDLMIPNLELFFIKTMVTLEAGTGDVITHMVYTKRLNVY